MLFLLVMATMPVIVAEPNTVIGNTLSGDTNNANPIKPRRPKNEMANSKVNLELLLSVLMLITSRSTRGMSLDRQI